MMSQSIVLLVLSVLLSITTYAAAKPTGKSHQAQPEPEACEEGAL